MPEPGGRAPAPEPLRLVQAFVNTVDLERGPEALATPAGLRDRPGGNGLLASPTPVTAADRRRAVALREALRDLAAAHNELPADVSAARAVVDAAAARARLAPVLAQDGTAFVAGAGGVD